MNFDKYGNKLLHDNNMMWDDEGCGEPDFSNFVFPGQGHGNGNGGAFRGQWRGNGNRGVYRGQGRGNGNGGVYRGQGRGNGNGGLFRGNGNRGVFRGQRRGNGIGGAFRGQGPGNGNGWEFCDQGPGNGNGWEFFDDYPGNGDGWEFGGPDPGNGNGSVFRGQGPSNRNVGGYGQFPPPFPFEPFEGPRPRFFWGRGYGPAGPPAEQRFVKETTLSFLRRCGILTQVLKGLPRNLIRMMGPNHCGVCAQELNDFDLARMHYTSKSHAKNQKKWLTQNAKVGVYRPKEIPLKSRDLYCELCDVHNTSLLNAESHYSGAPHRGIVEGRKLPKNPFLLQENMKERVEQLIRREKKYLKPVEKPEEPKNTKIEIKTIQPDLYCEICKTSVTCTEQMTMHLNGKKHLSKEKRHILEMMKGGSTDPKAAVTMETAETAQTAQTAADDTDANAKKDTDGPEKAEPNYYEDEFDWGQGSGKWEDDDK